ncbi:MAG: asparagine synthase (glutamine-hydrolyzing) [Phycisphaeraceae bacterium]
MCGIAGIAAFPGQEPPTQEQLLAMCDTIYHRGPDDCGIDIQQGVGLGMRRLSIIDLAGGHQPIVNEDGSVRVVYNGEIYNYRELRRNLENRGHQFSTHSDTEVLVHLWEEFGPDMANWLNGMFAFALHDLRRQRLLLARDHLGIKPLFYSLTGERIVFGSEVKVLLASGRVPRQLDVSALGEFLSWEYVPGEGTLLASVRKLEPGCLLDVDLRDGRARCERYWDIPLDKPGDPVSDAEWEDAVDAKLRECVRRQLVSDVPLGAFLSGGVDSSLVVAAMGEASTFSIGFNDPSYNELRWAQRVADHLGVDHDYDVIEPHVAELFDHLMHFMDDPIGDFSIFPTYLVSRHARQRVKVVLTGDGGDEIFGGYETYLAQMAAQQWQRVPSLVRKGVVEPALAMLPPSPRKKGLVNKARRFVEGCGHDDALAHARWRLFVGESMRQELFTPEARAQMTRPGEHITRLAARTGAAGEIDRCLYVDARSYMVDNCLVKMDRMSMANSLEARVPLLDRELVELAFRLPGHLKVTRHETKPLLKRVAARHVPRECVYRPKEGFSIPIKHWLGTDFKPLMDELLAPDRLASEGIVQPHAVERLKTEHLAGRANHSHVLWSLMVFQDWRKRWAV